MKNLKYLIPSLFTSLSLLSALIAIRYISVGEYILPSWLILFSMFCDFLDGTFARKLNAASAFGAQYDTMSDFVAFGVTPAFLAYMVSLQNLQLLGAAAAVLFVFAGCYRLVRFTLRSKSSESGKPSFIGLPIPVAAGFISSAVLFSFHRWDSIPNNSLFLIAVLLLSVLMVSRIEYLTLDHDSRFRKLIKVLILLILLSIILSFRYSYISILFWVMFYIVYCPLRDIFITIKKQAKHHKR